jgi:RNA polymerase sigma factor (sigma-70 family)
MPIASAPAAATVSGPTAALLALARERTYFERVVQRRYGNTITREDAEDIVSDSLLTSGARCPSTDSDAARAWFSRVVLNRAEDFRRARDGRPRSARGRNASGAAVARRFLSLDGCAEVHRLPAEDQDPAATVERSFAEAQVRSSVRAALERLDPRHAQVLHLRHMANDGEGLPRQATAAALDLPVRHYERLYTAARKAFVAAMADRVGGEQVAA